MPNSCCAVGCTTRFKKGVDIGFYKFPKNEERKKKWIIALKRKNWTPNAYSVICGLHFLSKKPVKDENHPDYVPSIFIINKLTKDEMNERRKKGREKRKIKQDAVEALLQINANVSKNNSSNLAQDVAKDSSNITFNNTIKDFISCYKTRFGFSNLHRSLSLIQKPDQYWGVTPTDKYIIFSRWNEKYIPEKRVVIEHNLNVKVFLGELEINTMNLMEFSRPNDISDLLEKVNGINYTGKSIAMSDIN